MRSVGSDRLPASIAQKHTYISITRGRPACRLADPASRRPAERFHPWKSSFGQSCAPRRPRTWSSARATVRSEYLQRVASRARQPCSRSPRPPRSSWLESPIRSAAGGRFLLTFDNHNSVNGIREFARAKGARRRIRAAHAAGPAHRSLAARARCSIAARRLEARTSSPSPPSRTSPASMHPLDLDRRRARARVGRPARCGRVRARRTGLDLAAGHDPTSSRISFYKMFGYPTGVGCLLVRHAALPTADAALVRRRHGELRDGAGPRHISRAARSRVRGRHAQLPGHSGGGDRPAAPASASASRPSTRGSAA